MSDDFLYFSYDLEDLDLHVINTTEKKDDECFVSTPLKLKTLCGVCIIVGKCSSERFCFTQLCTRSGAVVTQRLQTAQTCTASVSQI